MLAREWEVKMKMQDRELEDKMKMHEEFLKAKLLSERADRRNMFLTALVCVVVLPISLYAGLSGYVLSITSLSKSIGSFLGPP
jgi:ABC-type uncharacterized transport system permease subunit